MDSVQIFGGNKAGMPALRDRELGYCKDEKALYIGTANGNVRLCGADDSGRIDALETTTGTHTTQISSLQNTTGTQTTQISGLSASLSSLETTVSGKLTASQAAAQTDLPASATLEDTVSAYNSLLAAMRAAGIIAT